MTSNCSSPGDLQEPFCWIADVAVVKAFESGVLDLPDFYFTGDDYRYRFEIGAKRRFLELLRQRSNAGIRYNGHVLKWDTVVEQKANELGRFIVQKSSTVDFADPSPNLARPDDQKLRSKILALTQSKAKELGIGKSTLHFLRRNARNAETFVVYEKVRAKLGRHGEVIRR